MERTLRTYLTLLLFGFSLSVCSQKSIRESDKEQLGIALDYFSGGKYHEALSMFLKLDKKYKLNSRFKAYIGVCYYYEWNYEQTIKYIDPNLNDLEVFSPHERSVYYYASGESHFYLGEYAKADTLYRKFLDVCHDNERADALFRLGFCQIEAKQWKEAAETLHLSADMYRRFGILPYKKSRIVQIENMIRGCERQYLKPSREWIKKFGQMSEENKNR